MKKILLTLTIIILVLLLGSLIFFSTNTKMAVVRSVMGNPIEDDRYKAIFSSIPEDEVLLRAVFNSTRMLPSWAKDLEAELSFKRTIELLTLVEMSETKVRILLPQVRKNAEKYNLPIKSDTKDSKEKAEYVERRLKELGLLD